MCGGRPKAAAAAAAAPGGGPRRPFWSQPLGKPNRELKSGPPKEEKQLK